VQAPATQAKAKNKTKKEGAALTAAATQSDTPTVAEDPCGSDGPVPTHLDACVAAMANLPCTQANDLVTHLAADEVREVLNSCSKGQNRADGPQPPEEDKLQVSASPRVVVTAVPLSPKKKETVSIAGFMSAIHLSDYIEALLTAGYDHTEFLRAAEPEEVEALVQTLQMKFPHAKAFRKAVAQLQRD
jgi:hypothetical protein